MSQSASRRSLFSRGDRRAATVFSVAAFATVALAAAGASSVALLGGCGPAPPKQPALASSETWCPDNFEVGPQDTCFAVPEAHGKGTPILVYLHGMYTGHGSPQEWGLVHTAVDAGFAVVIPRGKRGLCAWKAELADHFCWPQEADDPQSFKHVVAEWDRVLWQVDTILEGGPHKRYVLGFSNGGFFASFLATQGIFPAQGYAIINGGALAPPGKATAVPMLLVSAAEDATQAPKMKELHEGLAKSGWTHAYCTRPGAHGLSAEDVDAALRFFKRDAEGTLKAADPKLGYGCEGATKPGG